MSLTAHPLTVAAELAWKRELLGGASLPARHRRSHRRPRWPSWPERLGRSARSTANGIAQAFCPVVPRDLPKS